MRKVGFGGGCFWCTEAIFQSLIGVVQVDQGWISSEDPFSSKSEAVVVYFDESIISLEVLVEVHLLTHSSTNNHRMRVKYRSAIYYFYEEDKSCLNSIMESLSLVHAVKYITKLLPLVTFEKNTERFLNYYQKDKERPFCKAYIHPKLTLIRKLFGTKFRGDF